MPAWIIQLILGIVPEIVKAIAGAAQKPEQAENKPHLEAAAVALEEMHGHLKNMKV